MIPYTYKWIDMGGVDLANVRGKTFSGLYQRVIDGLNEELVAVFFHWYFSSILIAPTYVKAVLGNNEVTINDLIIINSDDTINIPTMSIAPTIEELSIAENGDYSVPSGVDGYSPVHVNVPAAVESLSVTENGTYTAPSGVDGYNPVSVSVLSENPYMPPAYNGLVTAYNALTGDFYQNTSKTQCMQFYELAPGRYCVFVDQPVGTRFRCLFFADKTFSDFEPYIDAVVAEATRVFTSTANITGSSELSGENLKKVFFFTVASAGTLTVGTDNASHLIDSFVFKITT